MEVVAEDSDWSTTLAKAPTTGLDMLLMDWDLREACPNTIVVVLISHLDARHQAAFSAGANAFISKAETPERVAERLRAAAESVRI